MSVQGGQQPVQAIPPAESRVPAPPKAHVTQDQLNAGVQNGEISEEEAVAIRNEQKQGGFLSRVADTLVTELFDAEAGAPSERLKAADQARLEEQDIDTTNDIAKSFVDMNDEGGDAYRNWSPAMATDWYSRNRNTIDEDTRIKMDTMMQDRITKTLDNSRTIMDSAEIGSAEWRAAERNAGKALGLSQEMELSRDPAAIAGVQGNLPRSNSQLMTSTIDAAAAGHPLPVPQDPNTTRANVTIAERGAPGKNLTPAYRNAAYGLLRARMIDMDIYTSMMRTGAPLGQIMAARGIKTKFTQTDPSRDTWMEYTDANGNVQRQLVIPARKVPSASDMEKQYRNTFAGPALNHLGGLAKIYNTKDDPQRGERLISAFMADMTANEQMARSSGYDFGNINDVNILFQRWNDFHVLARSYDREMTGFFGTGPTFSQRYGSIDSRIFDRNFDNQMREVIEEEGLETEGGNPVRLTPLKSISAEEVQFIRSQFPTETQGMSNEEIAAIAAEQQQALGR